MRAGCQRRNESPVPMCLKGSSNHRMLAAKWPYMRTIFSEVLMRIPTYFRNGYQLRQPFECLQHERLGLVDLYLLVIRPAYTDSNDHIFSKYIERPAESVSTPVRFLANTIEPLRRHSLFVFLSLYPATLFFSLARFLLIGFVPCEPAEALGPVTLRIRCGDVLWVMFDDCQANRHVRLPGIVIALRHQHAGADSGTTLRISNCSMLDRTNLFVRDQAAGRNPWLRREWHYLVRRTALRRRRRPTRAALGLIASGANQNNQQWQNTNYRWKTSRHSLIVSEENGRSIQSGRSIRLWRTAVYFVLFP